jgi:starvation-inducible DNA-binding protein
MRYLDRFSRPQEKPKGRNEAGEQVHRSALTESLRQRSTYPLRKESVNTELYPSKNDLPESSRRKMIDLLNQHLADVLDLGLQAKQAHWNVKGPNFIALHELFDKVADEIEEFTDEIAERAVQLGGIALGTLQAIAKSSRLPAYALGLAEGREHVAQLSNSLADFGASARSAIDAADESHDADTADLFTEVSRGVDKLLWFVEAHLQSKE